VPGLCSGLVDGEVEPDRWKLRRFTGEALDYRPGAREDDRSNLPLLEDAHLVSLSRTLDNVELLLGWPPDVEWTGRGDRLTLLQARPITAPDASSDDKKAYYLTLRPGKDRLRVLQHRVADELIPELEAAGKRLASEPLDEYSDGQLAAALEERFAAVRRWRQIYRDDVTV